MIYFYQQQGPSGTTLLVAKEVIYKDIPAGFYQRATTTTQADKRLFEQEAREYFHRKKGY